MRSPCEPQRANTPPRKTVVEWENTALGSVGLPRTRAVGLLRPLAAFARSMLTLPQRSLILKAKDGSNGHLDDLGVLVSDLEDASPPAQRLAAPLAAMLRIDESLDGSVPMFHPQVPHADKKLLEKVIDNNAEALRVELDRRSAPCSAPSPELLIFACSYSRVECVRVLIEAGAPTDVPTKGGMLDGDTALNYALVTGRGDRYPEGDPGARPCACVRRSHALRRLR